MKHKLLGGVATLALLSLTGSAHAEETWLVNAAGAVAAPINDPYQDEFSVGAIGEFGVYRSLAPWVALGGRFAAGGIEDRKSGAAQGEDHGNMGIGSLGFAARVRPLAKPSDVERSTGLWLEGAGGGGILEDKLRPMVMPGIGYTFAIGDVGIGPMARYVHVFETGDRFGGEDAQVGTAGIELTFFDKRRDRQERRMEEFQPGPPPPQPMLPAARVEAPRDSDGDGLIDAEDKCPLQAETFNGINDHDGCPDADVEFIDDKLVIDEHVFFEYDKATLSAAGKEKLDAIADLFQRSGGDWKALKVQGHADKRGSERYNVVLSRERATNVASYLTSLGVPRDVLDIEAYGESRPILPDAITEPEFAQNRRVEFAIERK